MKKNLIICMVLPCAFLFTNCASIIHGSSQKVDFTSQPTGAKISINGNYYGETPKTIVLRRKGFFKGEPRGDREYLTKIELDGFYSYEFKIKRQMDGWFLGNLLFGGLIGIAIDAGNGSMYKLNPDQIVAQMGKTTASVASEKNGDMYITVTLHPDPNWEKIGALSKR